MSRRHIVTLADIAAQCGVTKVTVSRALRDPARHSAALTQRIQQVAQELGYDPDKNLGAQRMAMRKYGQEVINHLVAMVFPPDYSKAHYFTALHDGITDVLSKEGYGLLMVKSPYLESGFLPACFHRGEIDGLIIYEDPMCAAQVLRQLQGETPFGQRPVVSLISATDGCSSVLANQQQGAYDALTYLLDLGHRHFLYIHGRVPNQQIASPVAQGWSGYRQACAEKGYDPDRHLFTVPFGNELWEMALGAAGHLYLNSVAGDVRFVRHPLIRTLRKHPEITAVLTPNDASAILAYHILQTAGYRVPEDISLIGFDDTDPLVVTRKRNILTTVHLPLEAVGRASAKLLIDRITGKITQDITKTLPTTLVVRETTAPPPPQ
ncbi:MAG TPA: LacI family DNA-binding transcriptional regulator [Armatimonadota bacterium]|jgi:DNA-binding LacI/PurR family transcriptional regulator